MKNTVLDFKTMEFDNYIVPDYFSKNKAPNTLAELIVGNQNMIGVYRTNDNDRLERISQELYKTTKYWDVLMLLNRRGVFDMTWDSSKIEDYYTQKFTELEYYDVPKAVSEELTKNEDLRHLYIVKPGYINDFVSLMKNEGYI